MLKKIGFTLLLVAVGSTAWGQSPAPLARADIDKRMHDMAFDTITRGAEVFNAGKQSECYYLYEGALWSMSAVLDHHPALVKVIQDKLTKAKTQSSTQDKAFTLREALDAVMTVTSGKPLAGTKQETVEVKKKPLWDRLGGEAAVRAVVVEFLTTAGADKKANIDRNGNYPLTKERGERVTQQVVELVSTVTGGPLKYTGRDMKNAHQGMMITGEEFDAAAVHLIAALKKFKVPQAEMDEFIAIISSTKKDIVEEKKK